MNVSSRAPGPARPRTAAIALACAGVFAAYLPVTTVAVSLPAIQRALDATTAELSWVQDAFVLPVAALILSAGVFGDVHGRKKVYQAGLALAALGALVALCAPSVQVVWIGQALAGAHPARHLGHRALRPSHLLRRPSGVAAQDRALDPEEEAALRLPPPSPAAGPVVLDAADESLLAALRRDGRATLAELEAATGQSAAAIGRRLERLRTAGVLYFAVEYDREPLGQGVEAMCWLTCAPYALAEAGQAVAGHGEVRFAAAVTGRANLAVLVLCRTTGDLYTYLSERLGGLTGVQSVETTLALRRVKALTYAP
ncbi:Lrp/AsnC family transcriptional regulator [Nonomuraea wenchangensis]|uniref:Lrp/AsnC family transcriptional regulator n=1 Tax=Nonomuraea wenchangensis TaxID=568860 RepID=UPI003432B3F0